MIEITQHIFKEEMLAEGLMKTHAGYNILDNLRTLWDMPNRGDHANYHGIGQTEEKRYKCHWKNNTCIKCVFKEERGMRVNLLESIQIIAHESQGTIDCSKIQTSKWEKLAKCVVI